MTKRLIDLDDDLLAAAQRELNTTGIADTAQQALQQAVAKSARARNRTRQRLAADAPYSSQSRVIPKDLAAELGGQCGQPFRVSQQLLLALANDRLEESLQSGRRHQG